MTAILQSTLRQKYLLMPNRSSVTYRQRTAISTYSNTTVPDAWYRDLNDKEKAASDGVYREFERFWFIPQALYSTQPVPGDIVVSGSDSYTVLTIGIAGGLGAWKVKTVNLVLAAALRDSVNIQRATVTFDGSGVSTRAWTTNAYAALACRLQELHADIAEERGLRGYKRFVDVTLSQQVTLQPEDRISVVSSAIYSASQKLLILGYRDGQRIDTLPVITAAIPP